MTVVVDCENLMKARGKGKALRAQWKGAIMDPEAPWNDGTEEWLRSVS